MQMTVVEFPNELAMMVEAGMMPVKARALMDSMLVQPVP